VLSPIPLRKLSRLALLGNAIVEHARTILIPQPTGSNANKSRLSEVERVKEKCRSYERGTAMAVDL
jgi:hypothetical protein